MSMVGRLEGKVAIVTGAGRAGNIGVAICEAFLREGAKAVIGTDFRKDEDASISTRMSALGVAGSFELLEHDVTSAEDWDHIVSQVTARHGGIDVLVNNAGISIHGGVAETSLENLHKVMAVN